MNKRPKKQVSLPLGIKSVEIIDVKENNGSLIITLQKALEFGLCPACGRISQTVKDHHIHEVIDRPIFEKGVMLRVRKRRWKCLNDFCEVNTFTEEIEGLPKRCTHTTSFYQEAYELSRRMTYKDAYRHLQEKGCKIALSTLYQQSRQALQKQTVGPQRVHTPFVGLDEFSQGKERKYGVVLVDLKNAKIIDLTDGGKTKKAALRVLGTLDRTAVKACCIDMHRAYMRAIQEALPEALVVIDRFHVIKFVTFALDQIRRRVARRLRSPAGKEALKRYKGLLRMGLERLSPKQRERLWELLAYDEHLSRAHELKELLRAIYSGEDYEQARREFDNWIREAQSSNIIEIIRVAQTLWSWKEQILNYWIYRISNAKTEGKINKIKTIRRHAYNYNNFQSLRLKVLEKE